MKIRKIKFVKTPIKEYKPKFFGKSAIEGIEAVPINLPPDYYTKKFHEYESELKKYKDIEEELGIDLVTLFKALKQGIDMKTNKGYRHVELIGINECGVIVYEDNPDGYIVLPFDEYGKTWALTKEELE